MAIKKLKFVRNKRKLQKNTYKKVYKILLHSKSDINNLSSNGKSALDLAIAENDKTDISLIKGSKRLEEAKKQLKTEEDKTHLHQLQVYVSDKQDELNNAQSKIYF